MKWRRGLSFLLTGSLVCGLLAGSATMMSSADQQAIAPETPELKLVYDKPPTNMGTMSATGQNGSWDGNSWEQQALPLGNGFIGAMVFGDQQSGGKLDDRIQINEHTLWSGGPGKNKNYDTSIFSNNNKATVQTALKELQESLQAKVTAFTEENNKHFAETGEYLNYPGYYTETSYLRDTEQAQTEQRLLNQLKGNKSDFGSYQTLGDIHIQNTDVTYTNYERGLSLDDATAWVTYQQGGVSHTKEYFISYPQNVMAIRLTAQGGTIDRLITVTSVQPQAVISAAGDTITMVGIPTDHKPSYATDERLNFAQQVKVIPTGGSVTVSGNGLQVTGATEVLILMSAATNYVQCMDDSFDYFSDVDPLDTVKERIAAAAEMGYDALRAAHVADYKELFDRVKLDLCGATRPDKTTDVLVKEYPNEAAPLESRYLEMLYYQYGRYLLIGSSREGSLPANLQGIWADSLNPPWDADYHTNVNLQMNYWLAQQANLDECQEPLNSYINSLVARGELTAQYYHRKQTGDGDVRGWVDYHENNIWGYTLPAISEAYYAPEGAAWLCQALWEDYAFTLDKDELAENFDALLGAAIFWVDTLWEDERDGSLVASPSYSPEHGTYTLGATFTQSIIWELFNNVGKAAEVLADDLTETQAAQVAEVAAAKKKLYIPDVDEGTGLYPEWKDMTAFDIKGTDTPDSSNKHRHTNQLAGLHPGSMVVAGRSDEDDAIVAGMKQALSNRGDGGTGWGKAWKLCMWARLRDGDHAYTMLNGLLKAQSNGGSTYPNLLDTHAPFQIDGNFGATAGITEMLVQSQSEDYVDLFAAMPTAWDSGAVTGIKARGNFEIGMAWEGRKLQRAQVTSLSGGTCTLSYKGLSTAKIVTEDGAVVETTANGNDKISFATEAGKTYYVTEISQDIKLSSREVFLRANVNNLYSKDILNQTNAPEENGDNGVFVESVLEGSIFSSLGIVENEILTAVNDTAVTDVESLIALYNAIADGETVNLKVWNGTEYRTVSFQKAAHNGFFHVPGQIECEDYDGRRYEDRPKSNGTALEFVDNGTWVRYSNVYFDGTPVSATVSAATQGGGASDVGMVSKQRVYIKIAPTGGTYAEAKQIAAIVVEGSNWSEYLPFETTDVKEVTPGAYDVYLDFSGGVNMNWFSFGETVVPEPVPVDKEALQAAVSEEITDLSGYTEASAAVYAEALNAAKAVLADEAATQEQVDAAIAALNEAKAALETAVTKLLGDVNGDNEVNTTDARLVLQYAVEKITADELDLTVADVNRSTEVDTTDARLILQKAVDKIEDFD